MLIMKTVSYSLLDFKSVAQKLLLVSQPLQLLQYVNCKIEILLVQVRDAISEKHVYATVKANYEHVHK